MGETAENLSRGLDTYSYRQPLGVTAGICPFNFPAMIPLWMFPVSTGCGNTMILKPSEKDPGASMLLAQLARQAGLPDGVLQVLLAVHCLYGVIKSKCSLRSLSYRCHDIPFHPIPSQVVHGGPDTVNFLCDAPSVRAISFVGGDRAGEHIFDRGGWTDIARTDRCDHVAILDVFDSTLPPLYN